MNQFNKIIQKTTKTADLNSYFFIIFLNEMTEVIMAHFGGLAHHSLDTLRTKKN